MLAFKSQDIWCDKRRKEKMSEHKVVIIKPKTFAMITIVNILSPIKQGSGEAEISHASM
jgi:hypothetical protein